MLGTQPRNVVLAHGCFDLLHLGHIRHLQEAKAQGDRLIVSVTDDPHVRKGSGRPWFTTQQRAEALRALDCVDEVVINPTPDAVDVINRIRPSVYVKGIDYAQRADEALTREIAAVEALGGRFHVTKTDKWSSTRIINGERLSDEVLAYLDSARDRGFLDQIHAAFDHADKLNIVFIGETIIDEYRYVWPLAKPSKEFILATVEAKEPESFLGGVVAASLQAEWPNTSVITVSDQAIKKTRFVDADFSRKLFEVYSHQRIELDYDKRAKFQVRLISALRDADVAIMLDFGHGLMEAHDRHIVESAKFLAVNAQTNAGNAGFNPVTKYQRADYVCIDAPEARLAAGMQDESRIPVLAHELNQRMQCTSFAITRGQAGATICERAGHTIDVPAFASHGVDTIGAGDAFLVASAPLIAAGLDLEAAAFVGNVAGAIKIDIVGHRRHVGRAELVQTIEALLK